MKNHFQELYTIEDASEAERIEELSSDVYIPILDDVYFILLIHSN